MVLRPSSSRPISVDASSFRWSFRHGRKRSRLIVQEAGGKGQALILSLDRENSDRVWLYDGESWDLGAMTPRWVARIVKMAVGSGWNPMNTNAARPARFTFTEGGVAPR